MTADEVHGQSPHLRDWPTTRGIGFVPAVSCGDRLTVGANGTRLTVADIAAELPASAWQAHSTGHGATPKPGQPGAGTTKRKPSTPITSDDIANYHWSTTRPMHETGSGREFHEEQGAGR